MTLQDAQIQELDRKYKEYINNYTIDLYGYKYKITDETNYIKLTDKNMNL